MTETPSTELLTRLDAGQAIVYGGNRVARVPAELAATFRAGDRLVVVHETGDLLHIPRADHEIVATAVGAATGAFAALADVGDDQITAFFDGFAARLADEEVFAAVAAANAEDVADARRRARATGRLELTASMRTAMIEGLRSWRDAPVRRSQHVGTVAHEGWCVESWRDPLGVVGFVFEGRPNVFADATGVLRTGNTAVFRIGSDALRTARAIMSVAVQPSLSAAALPLGAVQLVDAAAHAAGWALFADARLSLAVARGSGPAVAQLGAVARQHGVPVSLHGTGGAWLVADATADLDEFSAAVRNSLDRKVCNTLNVCCVVADRADALLGAFRDAVRAAGAARGVEPIVHELTVDDPLLGHEWEWDAVPELALVVVADVAAAVAAFNRFSPRLAASLISTDPAAHDVFYATVAAPFVGDGFTRWVDGQFALGQPELGLSNWQSGRLFGRGGVLSGDSVHTIRLRARVSDPDLHR
jgi:glutamate-5-semialdehyde dehydrogenase